MREEDEPIENAEVKEEEWSDVDDNSPIIEEDIDAIIEKTGEEELVDFPDEVTFPTFGAGKH
ncbi:MAG: RNA polymerase sigma factor RpoS, partial [bacterium]|nr:RNA polymerase sigma factor RpoS [bacterium]